MDRNEPIDAAYRSISMYAAQEPEVKDPTDLFTTNLVSVGEWHEFAAQSFAIAKDAPADQREEYVKRAFAALYQANLSSMLAMLHFPFMGEVELPESLKVESQ